MAADVSSLPRRKNGAKRLARDVLEHEIGVTDGQHTDSQNGDNRLVVRGVGDGHKVMAKTRSTFVVENDLVENLDGDGPAADIVTREIDHSGPAASDLVSTRQTWDTQLTRHTTV